MALEIIRFGLDEWPDRLLGAYGIEKGQTQSVWLELIASRLHALKSGGLLDTEKASLVVIDRFRKGEMGPVSLETVPDQGKGV